MPSDGDAVGAHGQSTLITPDETLRQRAFGLADGRAETTFELHRHVGDPPGGDVGGDIDLAPADDSEIDDRLRAAG